MASPSSPVTLTAMVKFLPESASVSQDFVTVSSEKSSVPAFNSKMDFAVVSRSFSVVPKTSSSFRSSVPPLSTMLCAARFSAVVSVPTLKSPPITLTSPF